MNQKLTKRASLIRIGAVGRRRRGSQSRDLRLRKDTPIMIPTVGRHCLTLVRVAVLLGRSLKVKRVLMMMLLLRIDMTLAPVQVTRLAAARAATRRSQSRDLKQRRDFLILVLTAGRLVQILVRAATRKNRSQDPKQRRDFLIMVPTVGRLAQILVRAGSR